MNAKQIFQKTMPFNMAKLALGIATVLLSAILFAILMGIGWLFGEGGMGITFIIWLCGTGVIRFIIMHYMGYLIKAGHVAVITEAVTTGKIPNNQVKYGKQMVTERFVTSSVYFIVDKLVTGSVKQIQRGVGKVGEAFDFIPGMGAITGLAQFFVSISLGYIDECCLGYTFYKKDKSEFQSAADGVVIYAQNWEILLKSAAKTMLKVLLLMLIIALAVFLPVGLLFKLLHWSPLVAFLLACLIAWTIKFAFIDSYIMIQMMTSYMQVAPTTHITFDLYQKMCGISSKFKELLNKAQRDKPTNQSSSAGTDINTINESLQQTAKAKPIFCGKCGTENEHGTKFCGSCGEKL
ncbi:zinc ribbon domain-containing protein [Anaerovorax odorimutans]|uniref:zinc ribbon domain-containing protein n=1 Tax=Anaerovorax odorimutans TaxID=109327 RepID=UPI00040EBC82|nr:zinc ribbon domain-containing protein [Anaerovorax odorimutans]